MEKKRFYFKLGASASVFSDHTNGLKITKNVPGSTLKPDSKPAKEALSNGHIIQTTKEDWRAAMDKITPEERKCAYDEQGITLDNTASTELEEDKKDADVSEEMADLQERLAKLKMPKSKREEVKGYSLPELKVFVETEEKTQ